MTQVAVVRVVSVAGLRAKIGAPLAVAAPVATNVVATRKLMRRSRRG
jgi:hypothetical protein